MTNECRVLDRWCSLICSSPSFRQASWILPSSLHSSIPLSTCNLLVFRQGKRQSAVSTCMVISVWDLPVAICPGRTLWYLSSGSIFTPDLKPQRLDSSILNSSAVESSSFQASIQVCCSQPLQLSLALSLLNHRQRWKLANCYWRCEMSWVSHLCRLLPVIGVTLFSLLRLLESLHHLQSVRWCSEGLQRMLCISALLLRTYLGYTITQRSELLTWQGWSFGSLSAALLVLLQSY